MKIVQKLIMEYVNNEIVDKREVDKWEIHGKNRTSVGGFSLMDWCNLGLLGDSHVG